MVPHTSCSLKACHRTMLLLCAARRPTSCQAVQQAPVVQGAWSTWLAALRAVFQSHTLHLMRYKSLQPNPCPCRLPEGMPSNDAPTLRCAAPEFVPSSAAGASRAWLGLVMLQAAVFRGPTHFMLLEGMPSNNAPALRSAAPDFVPSRAAGACCARSLGDVACSLASCFSGVSATG